MVLIHFLQYQVYLLSFRFTLLLRYLYERSIRGFAVGFNFGAIVAVC